jgi:hypothetical protein
VAVEAVVVVDNRMLDMFGMYGCLVVELRVDVVQVSLLALLFNVNLKT